MAPPTTTDARFARLETDPRFRRPKKKQLKVEIDDRFKEVLQGDDFAAETRGKGGRKSDKYGRPLAKSHHADQLKQFYWLRSPSPSGQGQTTAEDADGQTEFVDYARGEGLLSSSGESEDEDEEEEEDSDEEEVVEMGVKKKNVIPGQVAVDSDEDSEEDSDDDEDNLKVDLSEGSDDDEHVNAAATPSAFPDEQEAQPEEEEEEEIIDFTRRFAVVNMDWDNMRAIDLYTVFSSMLSAAQAPQSSSRRRKDTDGEIAIPTGKLKRVTIYPSEFGKERMAKEEAEGPSADVFTGAGRAEGQGQRGKGKGRQVELRPTGKKARRDALEESEEEDLDDEDEEDYDEPLSEGELAELEELEAEEAAELEGETDEEDVSEGDGSVDDVLGRVRYDSDPDDIGSIEGDGEIDMDKLRNYQLERLRYYYAIVEFSDVSAATYIYREVNGTEFERTANVFDISFVPDDMEFDEDYHEVATEEAKGYKGNDFVTDALRHSNVKLTWDQDDPNRTKVLRRTLTRAEIEEDDFKAYLASSSEDEEEDVVPKAGEDIEDTKAKRRKAKANAAKLREMLLTGGDDDDIDVWGKGSRGLPDMQDSEDKNNGDMEITFKAGLSGDIGGKEDDLENLTTLEKYQRRMKEKKDRKKEKRELKAGSRGEDVAEKVPAAEDDFFGGEDEEAPKAVKKSKKAATDKRVEEVQKPVKAKQTKDLSASLASAVDEAKHFSMSDIVKAEKAENKKKRKRSRKDKTEREVELGDESFKVDVKDDRFKALFDEPEFAIDPSNPHFVKTKNMSELLSEGTRRRKSKTSAPTESVAVVRQADSEGKGQSLQDLVAKVKQTTGGSTESGRQGPPKRKRRRN